MNTEQIQDELIKAGIKNLNEYGYTAVTKENILTDMIYSGFFRSMLKDSRGYAIKIDIAIDDLFSKMNA